MDIADELFAMCEGDPTRSKDVLDENFEEDDEVCWCRHAFVLTFFYLNLATLPTAHQGSNFYFKAMYEIIRLGGDTDTNACIVGGMLGALLGVKALPEHMIEKVLTFDCTTCSECDGIRRPDFLSVKKNVVQNMVKLLANRPTKL